MGFWDGIGSGISRTISKQSAPRSRQIITTTPHHSIFKDQMLLPNQQYQCTEGNYLNKKNNISQQIDVNSGLSQRLTGKVSYTSNNNTHSSKQDDAHVK